MTLQSSLGLPIAARPAVMSLSSSLIRELADSAMGREGLLAFWFGESDQPTPAFIGEAAIHSILSGETFYSQNLGRPYLREAIADYLFKLHGKIIGSDRLAVTNSGVSALMLVNQMLVSPGDRVVAVTPLWPNITEIPKILGAEVIRVPLRIAEGRWALDLERLLRQLTPGTRALILNSPNNPTGWVIDKNSQAEILSHCRKHGIWIFSDDVYERLVHDVTLRSAPSLLATGDEDDRLITVNSFSKAWCMTGWRAGWIAAPKVLIPELIKLIEYNTSCVPEPIQRACTAALNGGEESIAELRSHLRATREILTGALKEMPGVEVPDAGGAMYVFFRVEGFGATAALARRLIEEAGLGLAPGESFGSEGRGWLRWCHAVKQEKLLEGIGRLRVFLGKR